jgi:protein-S-isoprenylcysteine O-methyltransferase Ste14
LVNRSGYSVNVVALLRSDRVVTQNGGRVEITVDPASADEQTNGRSSSTAVAVATRSSGTFGVSVALETVNGIRLDQEQLIITSTGVSGFGVALTVAALALLMLWWLRTRRANRTDRASPRRGSPPESPESPETPA